MKGIILAGGSGSRLHPITRGISKQLMPVYDKPMVYYPLSTLMMAGIREVLVITTPQDATSSSGCSATAASGACRSRMRRSRAPRASPRRSSSAPDFIGDDSVALVLGDNIFYGPGLGTRLADNAGSTGATSSPTASTEPSAYGVVEFDDDGRVISIEEKPAQPKSTTRSRASTSTTTTSSTIARDLKPSARGELEITAVNDEYLRRGTLTVSVLPRGTAWFDTGTFDGLIEASQFVHVIEARQGQKIGCVEEVAWRNGWIDDDVLAARRDQLKSGYGGYLLELLAEGRGPARWNPPPAHRRAPTRSPRASSGTAAASSGGFRADRLAEAIGHELRVRQTNISVSTAGALRGIHYADVPPSQAKYVTATSGVFIDFVVDIRVGSPTFGQWDSVRLDTSTAGRSTSPRGSVTRSRASRTARPSTCAPSCSTRRVNTASTRSIPESAWPCPRASSRCVRQGRRRSDPGGGSGPGPAPHARGVPGLHRQPGRRLTRPEAPCRAAQARRPQARRRCGAGSACVSEEPTPESVFGRGEPLSTRPTVSTAAEIWEKAT